MRHSYELRGVIFHKDGHLEKWLRFQKMLFINHVRTGWRSLMKYMIVVSTVSADGLAPLGARTSAEAMMIKFASHVHWQVKILDLSMLYVLDCFNSLAPGRFQWNIGKIIFTIILVTYCCDISNKIALRWTSLDLSDDKSALVQVMAWCRQATSHYLNQCWPRFLPPNGITRPQCFNSLAPGRCGIYFKIVMFKLIVQNSCWDTHHEIALSGMPQNLTNSKSTLVHIMAWCHQTTSHYPSQC